MQSVSRYLGWCLCVLCLVLWGAATAHAQLLQGSIRVQAEAVNNSGALVWRVNNQFSPADVVIDEATINAQLKTQCPQISNAIRARILKELTTMVRPVRGTQPQFFIDSFPGNNYSLPEALQPQAFFSALSSQFNQSNSTDRPLQFNQTPPAGFTAPAGAGETLAEHNWTRWQIEFDVMVLAVSSYELLLRTKEAQLLQDNGDTPTTVNTTMGEIADHLGIKSLTEDQKTVGVTLFYAPNDLQVTNGVQRADASDP